MISTARALWSILLPQQRRAACGFVALMLVGMVLEMFSVGLVLPALSITTGRGAVSPAIARWLDWLGNPSPEELMLLVLVAMLGVYAVKSVFLLFTAYLQSRFITEIQASTSRRLFSTYLSQPWTFHLQRNSSDLMHTINESQAFSEIFATLIMTASETLVLLGLVSLLVWFEPAGAIVVAAMLGAAAWLFSVTAMPQSRRWGASRLHHAGMFKQHVQQGLDGIRDVKIRGCEQEFLRQIRRHSDGVATMAAKQSLIEQTPRLWYELLAVAALLVLTGVMVWHGTPSSSLIPTLGLFATVAFRMLPSAKHMTAALLKLRFSDAMIRRLAAELTLGDAVRSTDPGQPLHFLDRIALEAVSFRYSGSQQKVLDSVSLNIKHGTSVGFVGGSGAGKSTLVDVVLGLLPPTTGRVIIDGLDIQGNLRGWQNLVGYVSQSIYLCDDTIRRNVAFGVPEKMIDDRAVRRALATAQLDGFVESLPNGVDTVVGERGVRLSGGQRQRIGIARALYHDPQVLLLDEATSALDIETEKEVMVAVNSLHGTKTLIIVAHRLSTVSGCDLLYLLKDGRIVQSGTVAEVIST
jgi:ABC-type multidrug transport system fused ATPase/permease subunit